MNLLFILLFVSLWLPNIAMAQITVDLYGDTSPKAQQLLKRYRAKITQIERKRIQLDHQYHHPIPPHLMNRLLDSRALICKKIQQEGRYVYANYETVYYPKEQKNFITIEVIRSQEKERLKWVNVQAAPRRTQGEYQAVTQKNDLVRIMQDYIEQGIQLMLNHELDTTRLQCTGYHCLFGYTHPLLKPYREKIKQGIKQQEQEVFHVLKQDSDPERRTAAAYLIGELNHPQMILNRLAPFASDANPQVRNAVIRVIANTMHVSQIKTLNLEPFIQLIDSPHESDRNKSLMVLLEAAEIPSQKKIISQKAKPTLLKLVKLKQPNNRVLAQLLLNKLG